MIIYVLLENENDIINLDKFIAKHGIVMGHMKKTIPICPDVDIKQIAMHYECHPYELNQSIYAATIDILSNHGMYMCKSEFEIIFKFDDDKILVNSAVLESSNPIHDFRGYQLTKYKI